jgi:hypothetical protein
MMDIKQAQAVIDGTPLLTTLVQSGAALVAIIAGLLVARLVALVGERVSLERRMEDLEEVERSRQEELSVARRNRLNIDAADFLHDILNEYLEHPERQFQEFFNKFGDGVRTAEELRPYFDTFQNDVRRIAAQLGIHGLARASKLSNWEETRRELAAPYRLFEREIADRLLDRTERVWRRRERATTPSGSYTIDDVIPASDPAIDTSYQRDLRLNETEAETALKATRLELVHTRRALDMVSRPQGLILALLVLGVVTVASVVVPLAQLTFGKPNLAVGERAGFVGAFIGSLLIFFVYLGYEMRRILKRS